MTGKVDAPGGGAVDAQLSQAPEMARLLSEMDEVPVLHRGDVVDGAIAHLDRVEIMVNVGAKYEGIIPGREMRSLAEEEFSKLKVGDTLVLAVLDFDVTGQVILSYDRARRERGWYTLQKSLEGGVVVEAQVTGYNRGGLLVTVDGVQGFLPHSQLAAAHRPPVPQTVPEGEERESSLAHLVGASMSLKVIEVDRRRQRAIFSERMVAQQMREERKSKLLTDLREGEVRSGRVTGVQEFGAFVDLGGAEGLIHISELSWEPVKAPSDVVQVGQEIKVYVMKVDQETKRISLSLRRTQTDPWGELVQKYQEGQLVQGTITRLTTFGAFARIEGDIEGLIHISELADRYIRHPKEVVNEGDVHTLKVLRIEPERRRLALSLRQVLAGV